MIQVTLSLNMIMRQLRKTYVARTYEYSCLKKNLNASRPSEHPSVRGEKVKAFRWDHRLQMYLVSPLVVITYPWYYIPASTIL